MLYKIDKNLVKTLVGLQHRQYEANVPVLVLLEGSSGRMLGRIANEIVGFLEPRGVEYHHFRPDKNPDSGDALSFLASTPANGKIGVYDRAWYSAMIETLRDKPDMYQSRIEDVLRFERYLTDNGVILIKIFIRATEEKIEELAEKYGRKMLKDCGYISEDHIPLKDYAQKGMLGKIQVATDTPAAPWDIVDVSDLETTVETCLSVIVKRVESRLKNPIIPISDPLPALTSSLRKEADLTPELKKKEYFELLSERSTKLAELQCKLAKSDKSLVLLFEGWDAAGKGGNIRRISRAFNPRGCKTVSVGVPSDLDLNHTYLWRFADKIPHAGRITIFDRTWYGRMLVEPVEGFCTEDEYNRAHREINDFERLMTKRGLIILKFWLEISPEEQLERFNSRKEDPDKNWKITDDDWRNREKWDTYEKYIDNMLALTSTENAPWVVISAEDKKYGRIQVMDTIIETLKDKLD